MPVPGVIPESVTFARTTIAGMGLRMYGATSGSVGFKPAAAAGAIDYTLPAADGTNGQALITNGSAVLSWATVTDHGALTGLTDDDHSQYALLAGRSGGQTLYGHVASGLNAAADSLKLASQSTGNAIPGSVVIQSTVAGVSGTVAQTLFDALIVQNGTLTWKGPTGATRFTIDQYGNATIDSDVGLGSHPLHVKYNGTTMADFGFSTLSIGETAGAYPVSFGGGNGSINTATGRMRVQGVTDLDLEPNTTGGGTGAGAVRIMAGTLAAELRWYEPSGSGTNYTGIKVQAQAADVTYTMPAAAAVGFLRNDGSNVWSWQAASAAYTITNGITDRVMDANATSIDELADLVSTIVSDLQAAGILA